MPEKQPEPVKVVKPTTAAPKPDASPPAAARPPEKQPAPAQQALPRTPPATVQPAPPAAAPIRREDSTVVAIAKPPSAHVSAPEPAAPRPAIVEAPRATQEAPAPVVPPRSVDKPAEGPTVTASVAPKAPAPPTRVTLNFPNRPATARELAVGDSWTYRLRDARANRNLATITHEIAGGDASGIRETVRIGERQLLADAAGTGGGSVPGTTQRRLSLQPRIFELPLDGTTTLFEFAPFLIAFAEPLPRTTWTRIPGASSADALGDWTFNGRVSGTERVRVAAGAFDSIKIELEGRRDVTIPTTIHVFDETFASQQSYSIWFVPEIGRAVRYERRSFNRARRLLEHEQYELVSYQLK
jgi:hypothetical protein